MDIFLPFLISAVLTYLFSLALYPIAKNFGLVDHPCNRKQHIGEIPLVGGIAIYSAVLITLLLLSSPSITTLGFLAVGGILAAVGAVDDKIGLSARFRLVIQLIAGLTVAIGLGIEIKQLGNLFSLGPIGTNILSIPITCIAIAGLANAYNMMDGADGLAATVGITALLSLFIASDTLAFYELVFITALVSSLSMFFLLNLNIGKTLPNKIFLGDAGSMFIGFILAVLMVSHSQGENASIEPTTALWFVAIPLMDMIATMFRRIFNGQSPFQADRTHLHHILLDAGLTKIGVVAFVALLSITLSYVGIKIEQSASEYSFIIFIIVFFVYYSLTSNEKRTAKVAKRMLAKLVQIK